jgi:hypothetical protein
MHSRIGVSKAKENSFDRSSVSTNILITSLQGSFLSETETGGEATGVTRDEKPIIQGPRASFFF